MEPVPKFELTTAERDSVLANRLAEHYERRIDMLRRKNDADLTEAETAAIRGQIKECKQTISLLRGREIEIAKPSAQAKA